MMAAVSSSSPFGPIQVSHNPAKAIGSPIPRPHAEGALAAALVLPLVEAVGGHQAAAPPHGDSGRPACR